MFFFLIFHTSISSSKTIENKLITTLFYGIILYLLLHGLIKTSSYNIFNYIGNVYWYILILDILVVIYLTRNIIDYKGMFNNIIDTSIYEAKIQTYITDEDVINNNLNRPNKKSVNINEDDNIIYNINNSNKYNKQQTLNDNINYNNENNNNSNPNDNYDMGTSLTDLGISDSDSNSNNNISDYSNSYSNNTQNNDMQNNDIVNVSEPEFINDFTEQINTDNQSNISAIDVNIDDFENNLS
jgi:hypothetical protein